MMLMNRGKPSPHTQVCCLVSFFAYTNCLSIVWIEKTIKWIKGALIGAGSFGQVYLGMDAATGLLMAVKQVSLPTGAGVNQERKKAMLSALEREVELLRELQHENIVQYHGTIICTRLCFDPFV